MNRLDHLINRLFGKLLDIFNVMDRASDADKSTVFYKSAVGILQDTLESVEIRESDKSAWKVNGAEFIDVGHLSVSFIGLRDALSLNCGRGRITISHHDLKHFDTLFRLLKVKLIDAGQGRYIYSPFIIAERSETTSDIGRSRMIRIKGSFDDEFYLNLVTLGLIDTEDDYTICPLFNMCEWGTFTNFVRSITIHYVSYYDHMGLVRVCSNCGKLNLKKRINKSPNSFCDNNDKCKNAYHRNLVTPHEICMQKVKEYYSAILVGVFGDNQGVYSEGDFPLSKNICQKCGETKPITSPEDCPVMKSDEKIQMLVSMHKAG